MGKNVIKKLLQTSQACSEETEVFFPFDYKIRFRVCEKILRCSKIFAKFRVILIFLVPRFPGEVSAKCSEPKNGVHTDKDSQQGTA